MRKLEDHGGACSSISRDVDARQWLRHAHRANVHEKALHGYGRSARKNAVRNACIMRRGGKSGELGGVI